VDVQGSGHEPKHPLLRKAPLQAADGFWMGPGFLGPLRRSALGTEEQRADEFIPLLRGINARQERVVCLRIRSHQGCLPATPRPGVYRGRMPVGHPEPLRHQGPRA
jgi:hypothetical protein